MYKKLNRVMLTMMVAVCMFLVNVQSYAAEVTQRKTVKIAVPSEKTLRVSEEYCQINRYTYDYLEMISNYADWNIELVYAESLDLNEALNECLKMVLDGRADIVGGILKNQELMKSYAYPRNPYGIVNTVLLTRQNNSLLNKDNIFAQDSLKIAVMKKARQRNSETQKYLEEHDIAYQFIECENIQEQRELLESREVDAMTCVSTFPIDNTKIVASYSERSMYFAASAENTALMKQLDNAIETIHQLFPSYQSDLFNKHFSIQQKGLELTIEQTEYIQSREPIKVLFHVEAPPYQYTDKDGNLKGIFISVLERISEETGLKFEYVKHLEGMSTHEMINSGACDMLMGLPTSDELASNYNILYSSAVTDSYFINIFNKNSDYYENKTCILALPKGSTALPNFKVKDVKYYGSAKECMDAVNDGSADASIINTYTFSYYLGQFPYFNINVEEIGDELISYGFAFTKPLDIELAKIINSAILSIPKNEIYADTSNIMYEGSQATLWGIYQNDPIRITMIGAGTLLLIMISAVFSVSYRVLHRKNKQLSKASVAKSEFLSHMSHEIRTPLNSILGFSGLALTETNPQIVTEYITNIQSSGQYLLGIINDILDMSKAEKTGIELNIEVIRLNTLLDDVKMIVAEAAKKRDISLRFVTNYPENTQMKLDELRIKQIFVNLISNAIKYSHIGGEVECHISIFAKGNNQSRCEIFVLDHGVGMTKEFLPHVFEPFTQEKNKYTTTLNSNGLGLSIVYKLVTQMGGSIWVESKLGVGSKFTLNLPVEVIDKNDKIQTQEVEAKPQWDFTGMRILLCEDHELNAKILKKLLEGKGAILTVAENGKIGLEQYLSKPSGYFEAVLMDMYMPVMSGKEASRAIRLSNRPDSETIPIIAVTANVVDSGIEELKEYGINSYVAKPINPDIIFKALHDLILKNTNETC